MTFIMKSASMAASVGLALTLIGGTAAAREVTVVGPPTEALTEFVSHADLNLASSAGVRTLDRRVHGAVNRVCAPLNLRENVIEHADCRAFARRGARPQMDAAILRAQQLAANGTTSIAPVAIVIAAPQR